MDNSWETASKWYNKAVGEKGHYYHQKVVLPGVLKLLDLESYTRIKIVDLACGQGILSRHLPRGIDYLGVDASSSLIRAAEKFKKEPNHRFLTADLNRPLAVKESDFTHATILLALQNVEKPDQVIQSAARLLQKDGKLLLVLNHPCFRIPRQSSWEVDKAKKIQFRRLDRYLSPLKIPIQTHPSKGKASEATLTYHYPLSSYSRWLHEAGFAIELMEEWISDKKSQGGAAAMEDRARKEFPLFLAISAIKK